LWSWKNEVPVIYCIAKGFGLFDVDLQILNNVIMYHSDDQSDFAPDDDLLMQQEIIAFENKGL